MTPDAYAQTTYSNDRRGPDGSFSYEYETDNGQKVKQESLGYGPNRVVRGYYSYVGPDGIKYTVNYIADRYGYRAYGAHLPTQPEAPPVYQRPVSTQFFVQPTQSPPPVYPLHHQHQTQTIYYPQQSSFQTQPIYVAEPSPSNYVTITPKPPVHHYPSSTQPPLTILSPPTYNFVSQSPNYSNHPVTWTTARPPVYSNGGFSLTTPRPYVSY